MVVSFGVQRCEMFGKEGHVNCCFTGTRGFVRTSVRHFVVFLGDKNFMDEHHQIIIRVLLKLNAVGD